jgi:hypothetical protein
MTRRRFLRLAVLTATLLGAAVVPALAQDAGQLLYERTLMSAANDRCHLFDRATGAALQAGAAQARGAALRAGASARDLAATQGRALAKAAGVACNSPDLLTAAARVRTGFAGYARLQTMSYPGDIAGWEADRARSRALNTWGLLQEASFGRDSLDFGIVASPTRAPALSALAVFADGAAPYGARLVLRDPARAPDAYLDRRAAPSGRLPLPARLPPASATQAFNAQARVDAPRELLESGQRSGVMFRFPIAAADALAALDPRESVAVDFLFAGRNGDSVRRAYLEVGDFAAGRAFLRAVDQ